MGRRLAPAVPFAALADQQGHSWLTYTYGPILGPLYGLPVLYMRELDLGWFGPDVHTV